MTHGLEKCGSNIIETTCGFALPMEKGGPRHAQPALLLQRLSRTAPDLLHVDRFHRAYVDAGAAIAAGIRIDQG
jgi:hypothetical protein